MRVFESGPLKVVVDDAQYDFLKAREQFVVSYCQQMGWDKATLSITQIMEIRSQEGWKHPQ
jgi:hypothetical protein